MKLLKFLFLASITLAASCWTSPDYDPNYYVKITNNSEHNITRVVIVATRIGKVVADEKDLNPPFNKLIEKNGGSRSFNVGGSLREGFDFIACVETEDALEPVCTVSHNFANSGGRKSIVWNGWGGNKGSGWLPAANFPGCPKVFAQCNPEVKDE